MKKDNASHGAGPDDNKFGGAFGRKKSKKGGEEDDVPIRTTIREIVEGKIVTIIMAITTVFALFGDDIRLWFTGKGADPYFYAFLCLSMVLFFIEILINSCVIDQFKYSFFFWLDIIASLSLIPDIIWLVEFFQILLSLRLSS